LGYGFFYKPPEDQRHFMLHELLHIHLDDIDTAIWQAGKVIESDAFTLMRTVVADRSEFCIDNIAAAIGHAFPLPEVA
jgi:hypothetical protein